MEMYNRTYVLIIYNVLRLWPALDCYLESDAEKDPAVTTLTALKWIESLLVPPVRRQGYVSVDENSPVTPRPLFHMFRMIIAFALNLPKLNYKISINMQLHKNDKAII